MSGISPDTSSIESEYCSASLELATPITKLYKRRERKSVNVCNKLFNYYENECIY